MAQQVRNVTNIIVNGPAAIALSTGGVDTLNAGEVGAFNADGTRINAGNVGAATSFFLARGDDKGQGYYATDTVVIADIVSSDATGPLTANAPSEQQDSIGYDGTSGSLEAISNNLYLVRLYIQELLTSSTDGATIKHFQYKSDASAIQAEIAIGLTGSAINNFSKEATEYITFKALVSSAVVVGNDFDNAISWVKGSKSIQCTTNVQYGGGTAALVGDYIRLHASDATVVLTDDTYKITAISGTVITVDRPIQVTAYTDTGNNNAGNEVITAATGNAADWGVDLQGQALAYSVGKFFYKMARWVVGMENFGTSTSASVSAASKGQGDGKDIADLEWFCSGFEGETYRMGEPAIYNFVGTADSTLDYAMFSVTWNDTSLVGFQNEVSPKMLVVAIPTTRQAGTGTAANAISTGGGLGNMLNTLLSVTMSPALAI
jgi:hypothetical protein